MKQTWKAVLVYTVALTMIIQAFSQVFAGPPPPPANTIQQGRGVNMPTIEAHDFFFRGVNLTDLFITIAEYIANYTGPVPVWEPTVEWGLVRGITGGWYNHTLPGEPVAIILQMHPHNITYAGNLVYPVVYDKTATQWQLGLYWFNGTMITTPPDPPLLVMYHMRWEPGLDDPNIPQEPVAVEGPQV